MDCMLSVIMPVYNDADFLAKTLESVLNQELSAMELICVNDASTDGSLALIQAYQEKDKRIKLLSLAENSSALQARRAGVEHALGKYIMFVDGDDTIEPGTCAELVAQMERTQVDILEFGAYLDNSGEESQETISWLQNFLIPCLDSLQDEAILENTFGEHKINWLLWNKIYRAEVCKAAFSKIALDHKLYRFNDMYSWILLALAAHSFAGIAKKYYHYNFSRGYGSDNRFTSQRLAKEAPGAARVLSCTEEYLKASPQFFDYTYIMDFLEKELANFYMWRLHAIEDKEDFTKGLNIFLQYFGVKRVSRLITSIKDFVSYHEYDARSKGHALEVVRGQLQEAQQDTAAFKEKLTLTEQLLQHKQAELDKTSEQLVAKQEEIGNVQTSLANTIEQLSSTQDALADTENKLINTRGELKAAKQELFTTQEQLQDTNKKLQKAWSYLHMGATKLLSVVVPVYGTEKYLKKCLDSIIASSYLNIEIVLVDDGSPGDVEAAVAPFLRAPLRGRTIKVVKHEVNKGLYHARLTGVEQASGEFIAFLDSDDSVSCDFYRKLIKKQQEKDADIVLGELLLEDVHGNKHYHNLAHTRLLDIDLVGREGIEFLLKQYGLDFSLHVVWNKVYKRSLWDKALPYLKAQDQHLIMCEDVVFSCVLFYFSERIANVHDVFVYYFQGEEASTSVKKANLKKYKKNVNDLDITFGFLDDFFGRVQTNAEYQAGVRKWGSLIKNIWQRNITTSGLSAEEQALLLQELNFNEPDAAETHKHDEFFYSQYTYTQDKGEVLKRKIIASDTSVISFDIFDTLIIRPFFYPTDLFALMEQFVNSLLQGGDYFGFKAAREYAEQTARQELTEKSEEVTLEQIYTKLGQQTGIKAEFLEQIKQKEIELELKYCKSRSYIKELFELANTLGKQVIITSDMYLPNPVIEEMLHKNGFEDYDKLYLSCDIGLTKNTGKLYQYIIKDLGVQPSQILHIGDNTWSDLEMAKNNGLQAMAVYKTIDQLKNNIAYQHYGESFYLIFDRSMNQRGSCQFNYFLGLRTMLAMVANRIYDNPFVDFQHGTDFNADPTVIGYYPLGMHMFAVARWLGEECSKEQYESINFFARDGYLPMKAFQLLQESFQLQTKVNYLPMTRASVLPLQINNASDFYALLHNIDVLHQSPKSLVSMFEQFLTESQKELAEALCETAGFSYAKLFSNREEFLNFRSFFTENFYNADKFVDYKEKMRVYFDKYFSGKVATFDVGYSCRSEAALKGYYGYDITPYYIHINNDIPYLRSSYRNLDFKTFFNYSPGVTGILRELLISAQTASCKSIIPQENGEVTLEYLEEDTSYANKYVIGLIQKGALDFVRDMRETFGEDLALLPMQREDVSLAHEYLNSTPKYQDMLLFKCFEFEDKLGVGAYFNMVDFWSKQVNDHLNSNLFRTTSGNPVPVNDYTLSFVEQKWLRVFCLYFVNRNFLKEKVKEKLQGTPVVLKCLTAGYGALRSIYRLFSSKK